MLQITNIHLFVGDFQNKWSFNPPHQHKTGFACYLRKCCSKHERLFVRRGVFDQKLKILEIVILLYNRIALVNHKMPDLYH